MDWVSRLKFGQVRSGYATAALFCLASVGFQSSVFAQRPQGVDVYSGTGNSINWSAAKSGGVSFAFIKAMEGTGNDGWEGQDADFTLNVANAKAAGVYVSYYYFCHPETEVGNSGADTAASYFWNVIQPYTKADGLTLMPMLDFEQFVTNASPPYTASTLTAWANEWCTDIVNDGKTVQLNVIPIIYTFPAYTQPSQSYGPGVTSAITEWDLFMSVVNYSESTSETGAPSPITPWSTWSFWQYSWYGTIPTTTGTTNVDEDVYNGTLSQMTSAFLITPTGPRITTQPLSLTVNAGSNVTLSVTSTNATHYQWEFNGANISGATKSSYVINDAQVANAGPYTVLLTNTGGSTLSSTAFLTVLGNLTNSPGAALVPTNMVDWWPAEGNCYDIYSGINGLPQGGFSFVAGKNGLAFHFDGSTSFITNNAADIQPPWTACMWVNYSHTPQTSAGLMEDGVHSLKLEQYGSSTHNVGISQIGYTDSVFNYAAPTGTWTHLAFVGTSSSVTLYANGVNEGSIPTNNMPLPRTCIGAGYLTNSAKYIDFMLGSLDDVMVFNRALSSTEINSIYHAGSSSLVRAPQLLGGQVTTNGHFNLLMEGLTGKNFNLFASTNIHPPNWIGLGLLTNTTGTNVYVVPNINKYQQVYFTVSQPY